MNADNDLKMAAEKDWMGADREEAQRRMEK